MNICILQYNTIDVHHIKYYTLSTILKRFYSLFWQPLSYSHYWKFIRLWNILFCNFFSLHFLLLFFLCFEVWEIKSRQTAFDINSLFNHIFSFRFNTFNRVINKLFMYVSSLSVLLSFFFLFYFCFSFLVCVAFISYILYIIYSAFSYGCSSRFLANIA